MSNPYFKSTPAEKSLERRAIEKMHSLNPRVCHRDIPKVISLVLSIAPKAEVEILKWIEPLYASIPWNQVHCLITFELAPIHRWCICMLHPAASAQFDRIIRVPYSSDEGNVFGTIAAAIYPGDCVSLQSRRDVWYTVYEIRQQSNCVLVATADTDAIPNPAKVKSERKIWRNYMEINPIHFVGCTVKREVVIGPLQEVLDDWHPTDPITRQLVSGECSSQYKKIFFQMPKVDTESALLKLNNILNEMGPESALSSHLASRDRPRVEDKSRTTFRRKQKQSLLFVPVDSDENSGQKASNSSKFVVEKDPVASFQRKKHVQVWASRKAELSMAIKALTGIHPNPDISILQEWDGENPFQDSLQLLRKRRDIWLKVGRALRAISRGGQDGHLLLSAWIDWTRQGRSRISSKLEHDHSEAADLPDEASCVPAWYSQRLPTNCDAPVVVEARTFIRKRLHELSKYNNVDVHAVLVGEIYDISGNMHPEDCQDPICQSILECALAGSEYIANTETQLHFLRDPQKMTEIRGVKKERVEDGLKSLEALVVPAALYVCTHRTEYWVSTLGQEDGERETCVLDEVGEVKAIVKRGDVLYLPMGKDDVVENSVLLIDRSGTGTAMQHAPCKWCEVLAVDLVFARLWVRPSEAAPKCWLDRAVNRRIQENAFWLPVSLLWDAVVFSPQASDLQSQSRRTSPSEGGIDYVQRVTRNGISYLECRYKAFNLPSLSSEDALQTLQALAQLYPASAQSRYRHR